MERAWELGEVGMVGWMVVVTIGWDATKAACNHSFLHPQLPRPPRSMAVRAASPDSEGLSPLLFSSLDALATQWYHGHPDLHRTLRLQQPAMLPPGGPEIVLKEGPLSDYTHAELLMLHACMPIPEHLALPALAPREGTLPSRRPGVC